MVKISGIKNYSFAIKLDFLCTLYGSACKVGEKCFFCLSYVQGASHGSEKGNETKIDCSTYVTLRSMLSKLPVWAIIVATAVNHWGYFVCLGWMPTYFNRVKVRHHVFKCWTLFVLLWFISCMNHTIFLFCVRNEGKFALRHWD